MSSDNGRGVNPRRILTIVVAISVAALMLAAPLFVTAGADAALNEKKVGYRLDMDNPTDEQLKEYGLFDRIDFLEMPLISYLEIFNQEIFEEPVAGSEPIDLMDAWGEKIESDSYTTLNSDKISADNTTITITAKADGKLINPAISGFPADYRAAAEAVKSYFGEDISAGDKVVITGTLNFEVAIQTTEEYTLLDGNKYVIEDEVTTYYLVSDIDLNFKLLTSTSDKSFQYVSDLKGVFVSEWHYEYDSETITEDTNYTAKNTVVNTYSGSSRFVIDGKDYPFDMDQKVMKDRTGKADIKDQASLDISEVLKKRVEKMPSSKDNMTVDKTYDASEEAFGNIVMDAVGNDLLLLIVIGVAVFFGVLLLVIVIVVVIVIKKKKK